MARDPRCPRRRPSGPLTLYVAGPLGFAEAGREYYYRRLLPVLRRAGHRPLDPWRAPAARAIERANRRPYGRARRDALRRANAVAAAANRAAIDRADALLAVLDGADVDSGTAAEIGYAFGRGKPIVGYRGDFRLAGDNDGAVVNLQVEYFIRASGGTIVTSLAALPRALARLSGRARPRRAASASTRTR